MRRSSAAKTVSVRKTKKKKAASVLYSEQEQKDLLKLIEENKPKNKENKRDVPYFEKLVVKHNKNGYNRSGKGLSGFWYRWNQKNKKKAAAKSANNENDEKQDEVYCVCRKAYDDTKEMIQCEVCSEWYHFDCVGLSEKSVETMDSYRCSSCAAKRKAKKRTNLQRPLMQRQVEQPKSLETQAQRLRKLHYR